MALIYQIKCDTCEFAKRLSGRLLFAVRMDGSEIALSHPGENDMARALTGMTLRQLSKSDRLRKRDGYVCLNCGTTGFYAERNGGFEGTIIHSISSPIAIVRTTNLRCANCGEESLEFAGGPKWNRVGRWDTTRREPEGCLPSFLILLGITKPRARPVPVTHPCPKCYTGNVRWKCVGIS